MAGTIVNINQGTQTGIANDSVGGTMYQTIKLDIGTAGASSLFTGTIPSITSVGSVVGVGGTVQVNLVGTEPIIVEVGTIAAGTINTGTINTGTINLLQAGTITKLEGGTITNLVSGTINSATVVLNSGTIDLLKLGTITRVEGGSIVVTAATVGVLNSGTINLGSIGGLAGSAAAVSGNPLYIAGQGGNGTLYPVLTDTTGKPIVVMSLGTIGAGTVAVSAGTMIQTIGTVNTGTIDLMKAGTITRVEGGSIVVTSATVTGNLGTLSMLSAGTITTIPNIPGGTINNLASGTINSATVTGNLGTLSMLSAGTISMINAGTLTSSGTTTGVGTLTGLGTVTALTMGTIKNDGRVARNVLSYGTTFGGTAAGYATLVGSTVVGAGTSIWVNDVSLINPNGNITCLVGFGTALNGSSVLAKGVFGTSSGIGIEKSFPLPVNAGMTNQDMVAYISGAGTIDVNISYFISA